MKFGMNKDYRIDCRHCRHYFVTWEPERPHGCRIMGFKSRTMPSLVVYRNSGEICRAYHLKAHKK